MQINIVGLKIGSSLDTEVYEMPNFIVKCGDKVVVTSLRGEELGTVTYIKKIDVQENVTFDNKILRQATKKDILLYEENLKKAKNVKLVTEELVKKNNLEMKIVDVIITLDNQKTLILFTSDSRVDFRELVKDLVEKLKCRIELKQIGYRDEVKHVGGLGPCGRICCCKTYNVALDKVCMKMAKNQSLSLNPTKISGLCGRLMCCLEFENDYYAEMLNKMPKVNSKVVTKDGEGTVIYNNILKGIVSVKLADDDLKEYSFEELEVKE